jgi:hypothetical protein
MVPISEICRLLFDFTQQSIFEVHKSKGLLSLFTTLAPRMSDCLLTGSGRKGCKMWVVGLPPRSIRMDENSDREELEKKLEQSRRMAAGQTDPVRQGWLFTLVRDLERRLQDQQ